MAQRRSLDQPYEGFDPYADATWTEDTTGGDIYNPGEYVDTYAEPPVQVDTAANPVQTRPNAPAAPAQTGRFSADQQAEYVSQAKEYGADDNYIEDFLARNPDDWNRLAESYLPTSHRPYDSQTQDPYQLGQNKAADKASGSPLGAWWGGQGDPLVGMGSKSSGGAPGGSNGSSGGSPSGGSGGGSSSSGPGFTNDSLKNALAGLFPNGAFNQGVVNQRLDSARDTLNRQRKSSTASNQAALANRGLIGDGPEQSAQNRLDERLFDSFTNAAGDIYADESENADSRMMQALQIAAGMTAEEAENAISWFRAQTDRNLGEGNLALGGRRLDLDRVVGEGNLALGNYRAQSDYDLGLRRDDLDWAEFEHIVKRDGIEAAMEWLRIQNESNRLRNEGYVRR
jgi:hypothetical protein